MKVIRFDWAIKYILRDKKNFDILEGFLSTLLDKDIKILEILESESNQEEETIKFNRVDLMVKSENEQFIIEIQNSREVDYLERILFGASKVIVENLKLGEKYGNITKVISVNILYFNLGKGEDYIYHGKTEFTGLNKKDKLVFKRRIFIDDKKYKFEEKNIFPEYYLIRTEKFEEVIGSPIDEWVYMFKNGEIKSEFKSKGMKSVKKKLDYLKMSEKERKIYNRYLMNLARENNIIETADQDGYIRGLKEGEKKIKEAEKREKEAEKREKEAEKREKEAEKREKEARKKVIDLVKFLINSKTDINKIMELTGLSKEEINNIRKK